MKKLYAIILIIILVVAIIGFIKYYTSKKAVEKPGQDIPKDILEEPIAGGQQGVIDFLKANGYSNEDINNIKQIIESCQGKFDCVKNKVDSKTLADLQEAIKILNTAVDIYQHNKPSCIATKAAISKLPKKSIGPAIFGRASDITLEKTFDAMKDLGVKTIRIDIDWDIVEVKMGSFDFSYYDNFVKNGHDNNIEILAILTQSPGWASSGVRDAVFYPPKNLKDYTNFVGKVVARYKVNGEFSRQQGWSDGYGIKYWEIWNEPNLQHFWRPKPNVNDYVEMLYQTNNVIRQIDENAIILNGGLSRDIKNPDLDLAGWLDQIYKLGAKDCFDIVNIHPYTFGGPPSLLKNYIQPVRDVMNKYNDNKQIWATEFGYTTGASGWVSEDKQAEYLKQAYQELDKGYFDALFWFDLRDGKNPGLAYGLLYNDFSEKPAYQVYKNEIK